MAVGQSLSTIPKDFKAFHQFSYAEQEDVIDYLDLHEKIEILKNTGEKKEGKV